MTDDEIAKARDAIMAGRDTRVCGWYIDGSCQDAILSGWSDALDAVVRLQVRQQELLALIAKLTRETPYPAELDECRSARAALIAEVGTLRARLAMPHPLSDKRRCSACGKMSRITTAGCDHCDMEDK